VCVSWTSKSKMSSVVTAKYEPTGLKRPSLLGFQQLKTTFNSVAALLPHTVQYLSAATGKCNLAA
jgi:hypothetical protein